ncbi:MAG: SAM-dependent methyltransferase [Gammaproteobacteria bacterium]|nr:MAG: SAM-dependent methyltransferase [Gammaproteobacteria bacterium]
MNKQQYWDNIYDNKNHNELSWHQSMPKISLDLIKKTKIKNHIMDIGGGASSLLDNLCEAGYDNLSVLDISQSAIKKLRLRLAKFNTKITYYVCDITKFKVKNNEYNLWYDRAVFHFLIHQQDRKKYLTILKNTLKKKGFVIIATFNKNGPNMCSGLEIRKYDQTKICQEMGDDFKLITAIDENHLTPSGATQTFGYFLFQYL